VVAKQSEANQHFFHTQAIGRKRQSVRNFPDYGPPAKSFQLLTRLWLEDTTENIWRTLWSKHALQKFQGVDFQEWLSGCDGNFHLHMCFSATSPYQWCWCEASHHSCWEHVLPSWWWSVQGRIKRSCYFQSEHGTKQCHTTLPHSRFVNIGSKKRILIIACCTP